MLKNGEHLHVRHVGHGDLEFQLTRTYRDGRTFEKALLVPYFKLRTSRNMSAQLATLILFLQSRMPGGD